MDEVVQQNVNNDCNKRDLSLDALKLFLIFLVIFGHFIESNLNDSKSAGFLYTLIYLFHMPLFVLLSGYFSKIKEVKKLRMQILKLCETFIVFSIPYFLYRASLGGDILDIFNLKGYPTWYLFSLIIWKIFFFLIYTIWGFRINKVQIIFVSFLIAFVTFFIPFQDTGFLSFMRVFQFLPFFAIGYCMSKHTLEIIRNKRFIICFGLLSIIVISVLSCIYGVNFKRIEFQRDTVYDLCILNNWKLYTVLFSKLFSIIGALILSIFCIGIFKFESRIAQYGSKTLFIFCLQSVVFRLVGLVHFSFLVNLLLSLVFLVFCCYASKYFNVNYITNPISTIIKYEVK